MYSIRSATERDLAAVGRLGALLIRGHYEFDPERFMRPQSGDEQGYGSFLGSQLNDPDSIVLVAEHDGEVVGYVYAAVEPPSWKELRDRAGYIHDVLVAEGHRRSGMAEALMNAAIEWLRTRGVPRVVLGTASQNENAQRLFRRLGFRPTMIEMTKELG
ncbi:MAG: GNAT family N-acetyltransferase [Vicinamibacterales bacterium]